MAYIKRKPPGGGGLPSGSLTFVDYNTVSTTDLVAVGENVSTNLCSVNVTINSNTDIVLSSWNGTIFDVDTDAQLIVTSTLRSYDGSVVRGLGEITKSKQTIALASRRWNHSCLVASTGFDPGEHTIYVACSGFNSPATSRSTQFSVLVLGSVT